MRSWVVSLLLCVCTATGANSFSLTTQNPNVKVKQNEGVDLTCSYSADFGSDPRVEWKFQNKEGSQALVIFEGKPTRPYEGRVSMYSRGTGNLRFTTVTSRDNGDYTCEVSSSTGQQHAQLAVKLTVLVPPSVPRCAIPQTVTTNGVAILTCYDPDSSPPPTYAWFKDGILLPADPSKVSGFKNATYKLDAKTGILTFPSVTKADTGTYYCEVVNEAGPAQSCRGEKMEVRDLNTGGIVAGVIIVLLLLGLLIGGIWYANKKGYLPKKIQRKQQPNAVYQPPSTYGGGDDDDGDFKQKSSFVV